jgi:hypothetical protein
MVHLHLHPPTAGCSRASAGTPFEAEHQLLVIALDEEVSTREAHRITRCAGLQVLWSDKHRADTLPSSVPPLRMYGTPGQPVEDGWGHAAVQLCV